MHHWQRTLAGCMDLSVRAFAQGKSRADWCQVWQKVLGQLKTTCSLSTSCLRMLTWHGLLYK